MPTSITMQTCYSVINPLQLSLESLREEPADYNRSSEEEGSEIASDDDGLIRKSRYVCKPSLPFYLVK